MPEKQWARTSRLVFRAHLAGIIWKIVALAVRKTLMAQSLLRLLCHAMSRLHINFQIAINRTFDRNSSTYFFGPENVQVFAIPHFSRSS